MFSIKDTALNYLLILISAIAFVYIEYFLPRTSFMVLVTLWLTLFGTTHYLAYKTQLTINQLFGLGVLFRLLLLIAIPPLSQDFNRFIWDGRLLLQGLNPYLTTPDFLITNNLATIHDANKLYKAMGNLNATNYTNYPPISQLGYYIAALFGSESILTSIVVMRLQLIAADIGIFFYGKKILQTLKLPKRNIFLYFLNPFIILELTGNLHYEPLMILFLVGSLHYLLENKWIVSAVLLGLSINVKLLPLVFIPVFASFFIQERILKKSFSNSIQLLVKGRKKIARYIVFCSLSIITNLLLFSPFYNSTFLTNYSSSIGLWFKSFEFNASIYYIARWVGYQIVGWNTIATLGKILPLFTITFVVALSILKNNSQPKTLFNSLLFSISIYLVFTTTVHPWYLSIPIALSVFTNYKYIYIWTIAIVLSYYAYSNPLFKENFYLIAVEYLFVFSVFIFEISKIKKCNYR